MTYASIDRPVFSNGFVASESTGLTPFAALHRFNANECASLLHSLIHNRHCAATICTDGKVTTR